MGRGANNRQPRPCFILITLSVWHFCVWFPLLPLQSLQSYGFRIRRNRKRGLVFPVKKYLWSVSRYHIKTRQQKRKGHLPKIQSSANSIWSYPFQYCSCVLWKATLFSANASCVKSAFNTGNLYALANRSYNLIPQKSLAITHFPILYFFCCIIIIICINDYFMQFVF